MRYYIVDVFTDQPFSGDPAGVVLLDGNSFPNDKSLPDFMIQVEDVGTLNHLQPDMNAVSAVTEKHKAVSFHVFAIPSPTLNSQLSTFHHRPRARLCPTVRHS